MSLAPREDDTKDEPSITLEAARGGQELLRQAVQIMVGDSPAFRALERDAELTAAIIMTLYADEHGRPPVALDPLMTSRVLCLKALMLVATETPAVRS